MNLKAIFFLLACTLMFTSVSAQEVLLSEEVVQDTVIHRYGPNYRHFSHFYIGYGFVIPSGTGDEVAVRAGLSKQALIGYRYKLKLAKWYALGVDITYSNLSYNINQQKTKTFPTPILHKTEKLVVNSFTGGIYNRFNFGRRGNVIGTYLDLGAFYQWNYASNHSYVDEYTSANGDKALLTKVTNKRLQYLKDFNYGVTARLGHNNICFYANYYLANFFVDSYKFKELPKIVVGLQIGIHN